MLNQLNCNIWDKVFKNGPSKIYGRQTSKNVKFEIIKGYLPQILLGPFLNTLSHIWGRRNTCLSRFMLFMFCIVLYDSYPF